MTKCKKTEELLITTEDSPGMLAEIRAVIASEGVNIAAICAYGMEGKATFMMVTSDNEKAKSAAISNGWEVEESEVVVIDLVNKVGAAKEIADRLKGKKVNLRYCYGTTTTSAADSLCMLVLKSDNNNAIIDALK